jgi:hypothetical protein
VLLIIGAGLGFYGWYKFFREVPQEDWVTATPEMRFRYGSIGGERDAGIPYWIFYVLPRVFPLPGRGYALWAFVGAANCRRLHEEDRRISRVGNTCATTRPTTAPARTEPVFINRAGSQR